MDGLSKFMAQKRRRAAKIRIWGGLVAKRVLTDKKHGASQLRVIVKAGSQKQAVEALNDAGYNITIGHLRDYWSVTGNKVELIQADTMKLGEVKISLSQML